MSVLFDDTRISTRPRGRSSTGLWLSVVLHAIVVVVVIVDPIRASEESSPRMPARMVFVLPATLPSMPRPSSISVCSAREMTSRDASSIAFGA